MYICTECGQQYKIKPQYCDCGNDEFSETGTKTTFKSVFGNSIKNRFDHMGVSPFALSFFLICLILSIVILFFYNPVSNSNETKTEAKNIQVRTNIPNIDKLWVESANKPDTTEVVSKPVAKEKIVQSTKKVIMPQKAQTTIIQKNNLTTKTTSKSQQKTKTTSTRNTQIPAKNAEQKKLQSDINPNNKKTTPIVKTTQKTVTNESAKKNYEELYNYKIQLRQALFSKLSVVSIQGSGKCGIEFSIDATGKLINRNFTYQSDNKTVNDEVYKMLMRLPKYYPPPSGYNGEKIKMIFSFDNGSYSINYTN